MPRARAIRSPSTNFIETGAGRSIRMVAGSIGAGGGLPDTAMQDGQEPMEPGASPGDNDAWARELAQREAAAGLPVAPSAAWLPGPVEYVAPPPAHSVSRVPTDLSALPDRFSLEIERKPDGWWVVRAPGVHVGLFVAHQDLTVALADAPGALAGIVRLDGVVSKKKTRS